MKGQRVSQWFERFQAAKAAAARVPTCPHDTPGSRDGQSMYTACGEILDEPGAEHCPPEASAHAELSDNPQEEDPLVQYWSDVLQACFWVAPTAVHAAALAAQGQVAYQPDEIWHLRDLKGSDPQAFPAKLRAIHQAKNLFNATISQDAHPAPAPEGRRRTSQRPAKQRDAALGPILPPCAACGELRHWHDRTKGHYVCWTCTPPSPLQGCALPPGGLEPCPQCGRWPWRIGLNDPCAACGYQGGPLPQQPVTPPNKGDYDV